VAVLDDGFQHRRVARGLDLVVIDGGAGTFNQSLLPAGWLREPVSSLRRADAVIVTHADEAPIHLDRMIEESHGRRPIAHTNHTWDSIDLHSGEQTRSEPPRWLDGRRVVTRLGVGRPEAVVSMIESCGATVISSIPAADHEAFTPRSMEALRTAASDADVVVMTAKDWVNARGLIDWAHWSTPIAVPQLTLSWVDGEAALWSMILAAAKQ
jgi:tetraacyldisaccharide 4'-kinase